ncbi:E3 ubiquitin-protein ligase RNF14 [Echinococcus granulosus]|uniref:RBR-type E3 ubiquitin transferase n=1 Tax=Echinococcus granulosus TaxID=6210 RepID=A0A068WEH8_ECHGR|nr:E3 ubiquitin-protein ligase RNF14 [Echinococcus granulosus]CDS16056.1 e3 ubiquitin protein ligase rnf14 [Echinococcus granulosus]
MDLVSECKILQEFCGSDALYFKRCDYGSIKGFFVSTPAVPCIYLKVRESFPIIATTLLTEKKASEKDDGFLEYRIDVLPRVFVSFYQSVDISNSLSFIIRCDWLQSDKIKAIDDRLVSIYEEHIMDSPLGSHFTFIEHELLAFLFPSISGSGVTMIFESAAPENIRIVNFIIEHNEQKLREISPEKIYLCEVCLDGVPGKQSFRFSACSHLFCRKCIRDTFETNLNSGLPGGSLRCLACDREVAPFEIRALLSKELYERYEMVLLARALDQMSDIAQCPRKDCQTSVVLLSPSLGKCSKCELCFCPKCRRTYHGEGNCTSILPFGDITLEEVAEIFEGTDEELKQTLIGRFGENSLRNLLSEHYTLKYKAEKTQRCPRCQAYVQRMEGCNAMQCSLCGEVFCWLCLKRLDAKRKYDHYGSGPCSGKLFEAHAIDENQNEVYHDN